MGGSYHISGGDMSCPSHVYSTGIFSPSWKAGLDKDNVILPSSGIAGPPGAQATTPTAIIMRSIIHGPTCLVMLALHSFLTFMQNTLPKPFCGLYDLMIGDAICPNRTNMVLDRQVKVRPPNLRGSSLLLENTFHRFVTQQTVK